MPTIKVVHCDHCRDEFGSVEVAERHEQRCESRPTGAEPGDICRYCGEREDLQRTGFVHGDTEPSTWYVHRPSGWRFPEPYLQHRFWTTEGNQ